MKTQRYRKWILMKQNWLLYVLVLPCVLYILIFHYFPLYGIQMAFKDFSAYEGIWGSPWVGMKHFTRFFESVQFWSLIKNTLILSLYQLIASFPIPIILALMLNYTSLGRIKRFVQTLTYAPHLISTVVIVGMLIAFTSSTGVFNQILGLFGVQPILFMGQSSMFRSIYVWSDVWQNTGWNAIIYIAVLTSVNQELHEAALVDGASILRRIWHIDLVALMPTIMILLIMNLGSVMNLGFEKAFLMQNDMNLETSEIISTYVYKIGIQSAQYSYATAIGLFNNVINFVLLVVVNRGARAVSGTSLW